MERHEELARRKQAHRYHKSLRTGGFEEYEDREYVDRMLTSSEPVAKPTVPARMSSPFDVEFRNSGFGSPLFASSTTKELEKRRKLASRLRKRDREHEAATLDYLYSSAPTDDGRARNYVSGFGSVPGAPVGTAVANQLSPSYVPHPHDMNTVSNFHHRRSIDTGSGGSSSSPIGSGPMGTISPGGGVYFPRSPRTAFSSSPSTPSPLTEEPHSSSASALPSMSSQQQRSQHPTTIAERPFRVLQPHESLACGLASPLSYGEPLRMGSSQPQPSLIKPVPIRPQMPPPIQSGSRSAFSSPCVSHRNERPLTVTAEVTYLSTENRSIGPTRTNSDESVRIARDIMGSTAVDSPRLPGASEFMFDNDLTSRPQTGDVNSTRAQMDVLMRKNQKSGGSRASASHVSARTVHTSASQPHLNPAPSSAFDSPQPFLSSSSSRPAFEPATSDSIWRPTSSGFMFDSDLTSHPKDKVGSAQMDALMRKNMEKKIGCGGARVSRGSGGSATNRNQTGLGGGRGKGGSTLCYRPQTDERYQEEPPRQKTAQETQNEIQSYQRVREARLQADEARQRMLKKKKKMGIVDESNEDSVVPAGPSIERDPNFVAPTERGLHNQQRVAVATGLGVAGSSGASAEGTGTSTSSDKLAAASTEIGSTSAEIRMRENERRCHEMCTRIADFVNYDPRSPIPTPSVDVVFEKSIHNVDRFVEQLARRNQNCVPDNESYSILINGMAHPPELVPRDRQQLLRPVIVDACAVAHAYSTYYKPYWGETSVSQPYHTERVMPMQPLLDVALHFITAGHQVNIVMPKLYESPYYRGKQSRPLVNDLAIYEALRSAGIMSFADPVKSPRRKDLLQVIRQMVRKVDGCFVSNVDVERTYAPRRLEDPADLPLNALPDSVFEKRPAVTDSSPSKAATATASDCESSPKMKWSNGDDEPAVPMVMCRTAAADTIDMTQVKRQRVHAESALRLLTPSFVGPGKMMVILHQFHQFVGGSDVAHDQRKKYYECVGERTVLMYTERDGDQADYGVRVGCQLKIRDQLRQLLILSTARALGAAHMRTIQVIARLARLCNLDVPELDSFVTRFATAPAPSTPTPELDESLELEEEEQDGESAYCGVSDADVPSTSSPLIPISPINSPVCGRSDSPEDLISFNQPHLSEDALAVMEPTRDDPSTSSEAVTTPSSTPRDTTPEVGQLISISPPTVSGVDDEKERKSPNSTTRSSASESVSFFSVLDTANLDEYVDNELADVLLPINLSTSSIPAAVPIPQSTSSNVYYDYEDYLSDRTLSPIDMDFSEYVTED